MQCIYCQNHNISVNDVTVFAEEMTYNEVIGEICKTLEFTEDIVGFVSPSHYIPQMLAIIRGIKKAGRNPIFVYNSNGYDKVETLKILEDVIDVYLPDFKYMNANLALHYSRAKNYQELAAKAIKEMYRQKGSSLIVNDNGIAERGIIIRHLILPNAAEQSIEVLKYIAEEISPNLHISLMSQYYPTPKVKNHKFLGRTITYSEYRKVVNAFYELGFSKGWLQDLESQASFRPDFLKDKPFEI